MSDKLKNAIEELERLRLDLFRSAADIDDVIKDLKLIEDDPAGLDFIRLAARNRMLYRLDMARLRGWDKLDEKENEIWHKLFDDV